MLFHTQCLGYFDASVVFVTIFITSYFNPNNFCPGAVITLYFSPPIASRRSLSAINVLLHVEELRITIGRIDSGSFPRISWCQSG